MEETVKTLVAVYKLSNDDVHHLQDLEQLLSPDRKENHRPLSEKQLKILARHLYSNIVNYVIKAANTFGAPSDAPSDVPSGAPSDVSPPTSPLLSLFILHSFPLTTRAKQSNNLQDLLVNLHKETFRVI